VAPRPPQTSASTGPKNASGSQQLEPREVLSRNTPLRTSRLLAASELSTDGVKAEFSTVSADR